jgi:hypothetical protein
MSEKKQTAVEWLVEQMRKPYSDKYIMDILNQTKAMEKEQITQAYLAGDCQNQTAEQYYNETYIQ